VLPAVVADRTADILGHGGEVGDELFEALVLQVGPLGHTVEVGDVGVVVLVVVEAHRIFVYVRLQRVVVVG
jgi:hypothetical protein